MDTDYDRNAIWQIKRLHLALLSDLVYLTANINAAIPTANDQCRILLNADAQFCQVRVS